MPIYHSVTELIGRTPLLELCNCNQLSLILRIVRNIVRG